MKVRNPDGVVLSVSEEKGARLLTLRGWAPVDVPAPAPAVEQEAPKPRARRKTTPKTEEK